jgi:hypothetical protein
MRLQVRTAPKLTPAAVLLALVCFAACAASAKAEPAANPTSLSFAAGGTIRMKLHRGTIEIVGVPENKITVSWRSSVPKEERDVSVNLQSSSASEATLVLEGPSERMRYRIEVPQRSDVGIDMQAGELKVRGIQGSMDIELLAGEMDLRLPEPKHYRKVSAAVTFGELDAQPWGANTSGVWRSFKATGDGSYDLRAQLLAGELRIGTE